MRLKSFVRLFPFETVSYMYADAWVRSNGGGYTIAALSLENSGGRFCLYPNYPLMSRNARNGENGEKSPASGDLNWMPEVAPWRLAILAKNARGLNGEK